MPADVLAAAAKNTELVGFFVRALNGSSLTITWKGKRQSWSCKTSFCSHGFSWTSVLPGPARKGSSWLLVSFTCRHRVGHGGEERKGKTKVSNSVPNSVFCSSPFWSCGQSKHVAAAGCKIQQQFALDVVNVLHGATLCWSVKLSLSEHGLCV